MKIRVVVSMIFLLSSCGIESETIELPLDVKDLSLSGPLEVLKVTDGDTIHVLLEGEDTKVRIIGINTPETVSTSKPIECFGPESSEYAETALGGKSVYLEFDESQGRYDRYDRTLAHVWTQEMHLYAADAILLGFGEEMTYDGEYKYREIFVKNEMSAKKNSAGLWGNC